MNKKTNSNYRMKRWESINIKQEYIENFNCKLRIAVERNNRL